VRSPTGLWEDYREFCKRDLSGMEVEYLVLDAVYESSGRYGVLRRES
jgi:hypothetical protein